MSNELKLTKSQAKNLDLLSKSQAKNLDLLSKLGSIECVTKHTAAIKHTKLGKVCRFFSILNSSQVKGATLYSLGRLEGLGLASSTSSTTYSKDFSKELRSVGPVGSWYKTVTVFTIN